MFGIRVACSCCEAPKLFVTTQTMNHHVSLKPSTRLTQAKTGQENINCGPIERVVSNVL
jgi:hypothetical protein